MDDDKLYAQKTMAQALAEFCGGHGDITRIPMARKGSNDRVLVIVASTDQAVEMLLEVLDENTHKSENHL